VLRSPGGRPRNIGSSYTSRSTRAARRARAPWDVDHGRNRLSDTEARSGLPGVLTTDQERRGSDRLAGLRLHLRCAAWRRRSLRR
jgi:hypothetical protein